MDITLVGTQVRCTNPYASKVKHQPEALQVKQYTSLLKEKLNPSEYANCKIVP